jgi:hypothetical protein
VPDNSQASERALHAPCRLQAAVVARRVTLGCATTLAVVQSWLMRSMDALESNVTAAYHSDADSELPPSWCLCGFFPRTHRRICKYILIILGACT